MHNSTCNYLKIEITMPFMQITLEVLYVKKDETASLYKLCHVCKGAHIQG
jgi:hypothetical protein